MLYYMGSKKHLPERIVPLGVPLSGYACMHVHVRIAKKTQDKKHLGIHVVINERNIFCSPTEYSLKETSFCLHPIWGTHPAQPAVTIVEVFPLCPSRINGNIGHKYKSQATQHGHILSHIDAYNGEEKADMEKERICDGQKVIKVIIFSFHIGSPQVLLTHIVRPEWSGRPYCIKYFVRRGKKVEEGKGREHNSKRRG